MKIKHINRMRILLGFFLIIPQPRLNAFFPILIRNILFSGIAIGGAAWLWRTLFVARNVRQIQRTTTQAREESAKAHQDQKQRLAQLRDQIDHAISESKRILDHTSTIKEDTSQIKQDTKNIQLQLNRIEEALKVAPPQVLAQPLRPA